MSLIVLGLGWLAGVAAGLHVGAPIALFVPPVVSLAASLIAPRRSLLAGTALVLSVTLLGGARVSLALPAMSSSELTPFRGQTVQLSGYVAETPRCRASTCTFLMQVDGVRQPGANVGLSASLLVSTSRDPGLEHGQALLVRGELRAPRGVVGFPRVAMLARRGIHETMSYPVISAGAGQRSTLRGGLEDLRRGLEAILSSRVPGVEGQLAAGLLLGRDVALEPGIREQLRVSGTSHILAVSGFNVALVGGAVLGAGLVLLPRGLALMLAVVAVVTYTLLVGSPPSAVRAAIMFSSATLASFVGRLPDPLTSLVLAASVMTAVEPAVLLDLGFQLSFVATGGLVLLGARLTPPSPHLLRGAAGALGQTLAAQAATLPLVLYTFHSLSLVAPLANVLIGCLLPVLVLLSVLVLTLGTIAVIEPLLAAGAWWVAHLILGIVGWTSSLPFASLSTGSLPLWGVAAVYGCGLIAAFLREQRLILGRWQPLASRWAAAFASLAILLAASVPERVLGPERELRIVFFDVAGGTLTLLETNTGRRALLGASASALASSAVAGQLPFLDHALDLIVVTRAGETSRVGLAEVVRRYPVGVVVQPADGSPEVRSEWRTLLAERGVSAIDAVDGMMVELDDETLVSIRHQTAEARSPSLSVRISHRNLDVLLPGSRPLSQPDPDRLTVIRLEPGQSLPLAASLAVATPQTQPLVIGGRAVPRLSAGVEQIPLGSGEVVVLTSDGVAWRMERRPCSTPEDRCAWP